MSAAGRAVAGAIRASLLVSPRPVTTLMRLRFAQNGRVWGGALAAHAPADVRSLIDERYGAGPDEVLDVHLPPGIGRGDRRPTVVWTHGGAFVGGSKTEISGYLRILAGAGLTAVGVRYSRAPEARYPTPVRQVVAALGHLRDHGERLHVDGDRIVLAGDSAGAQIAAQAAAALTNPAAAVAVAVEPTLAPEQVRGVVLCCGVYDLAAFGQQWTYPSLVDAVCWAYSGVRRYRRDPAFMAGTAVATHVDGAFPATFLTAGNADPLTPQSVAFAEALRGRGVEVETLFYPPDHQPPLEHEYQFHLHLDDARTALARIRAFVERRTT